MTGRASASGQGHRADDSTAAFARALERHWPALESGLLSVSSHPAFPGFIAKYSGLPLASFTADETLAHSLGARLATLLKECVASALCCPPNAISSISSPIVPMVRSVTGLLILDPSAWSSAELESALEAFEKTLNLALYYWHAPRNKNFQFRTVVHFAGLEGRGDLLIQLGDAEYAVSFNENGVRLGRLESEHIPKAHAIDRGLGLEAFPLPDGSGADLPVPARLVARLRTLQREICLLVDEWEHRNSLLAVEFNHAREQFRTRPRPEAEALVQAVTQKMNAQRDHLANWCLEAAVTMQCFLVRVRHCAALPQDILLEADAAETVLLSGLQKIFLPASVSRHQYELTIARRLKDWARARLAGHPDDLATALSHIAFSLATRALETDDARQALALIAFGKSHSWRLSFDPSSALKAFAWALHPHDVIVLAQSLTVAFAKKLNPDPLDTFWLSTVASFVQMPDTFSRHEPPVDKGLGVGGELGAELQRLALDAVTSAPLHENHESLRHYLIEAFSFSASEDAT